jgi:hypothetical protein
MKILLQTAEDHDARIRSIAFTSIRNVFEDIPFLPGLKTPYHLGLNGLTDDDASVRLECILLLS